MATIVQDGTKIRYSETATQFIPEFSESIDLKITNQCSMECAFCHENSVTHADILNLPFFSSIHRTCNWRRQSSATYSFS